MAVKIDGNGPITGLGPAGQCRLVKSGANLLLAPFSGNQLYIDQGNQTIPGTGVILSPTGLTADVVYYIYAYMNAGVMALEPSTTGHTMETTSGFEKKTGDATRTLVGMVSPAAGPAFVDTLASRRVISWFNRRTIEARGVFTADRGTSGSEVGYSELNSEIRATFLSWAGDLVRLDVDAFITHNGTATNNLFGPSVDATNNPSKVSQWANSGAAGTATSMSAGDDRNDLSESLHYVTLSQWNIGANSCNFIGTTTDARRATRCKARFQG